MSNLKKHLEKIQKEEAAANFAKWIRNDAILDDDDEPRVLYSGTLSEFESFDITHTRPEAYFGQGFYFSDSLDDASDNYARREGPDHVVNTDNERYKLTDDLENFLEMNYKDQLENPEDSEMNQKIKNIYDLLMDGEDIDDELLDELFEFHEKEKLKRTHDGFVMPVFLVARKLMDVDNHTFEADEDYGDFNELLQHFDENFSDISSDFRIELESLLSCPDDESYPDLEEVLGLLDSAIESSCMDTEDEDDLEKIEEMKAYIEKYYEIDDERCLTYKLSGEGPALRDNIIKILENNGCESDANQFREAFNTHFSELESTFTAVDFIENEDIQMALCDSYVEVDNIYNMHVSGSRALFAMAIQEMGYDTIKMDPSERFRAMNHVVGTTHYISFNPLNIKSAIGNNGEYSLTDPDILHRVCKNSHDLNLKENAITFTEASHIIRDIGLHYKNMPRCEIHTNFDEISHSIVGKDKNIESCTGWFDTHSHSIHVYLPNIMNRKELEKTICHELFGHLSLRDIMGDNYERTMNKVYDYYESKGQLEDIKTTYVDRYNLNLNNRKDRAIIAEEKMAEVIEEHGFKQFPLRSIIMGAIRNNIRKVVSSLNINENDITYMMYQSHKNMLEMNHKSQKKKAKIKHH
jgi:hypothetical protein